MITVGERELRTQLRVVEFFRDVLGYAYLGHWKNRPDNGNVELAKKPASCLVYVLVHEMVHLLERNHTDRFRALMDQHLPQWPVYRDQLNSRPLAHDDWRY